MHSYPDAHWFEHSLEVQVPFLQYFMKKDFKIVPVLIGSYTNEISEKLAKALRPYFNSDNLFVISTDFSHYPRYSDAKKADKNTADAIVSNSPEKFLKAIKANDEAGYSGLVTSCCGWTSVLTLLNITKNMAVTYKDIQYMNSGDTEVGDTGRVVGYHAIAVSGKIISEVKKYIGFTLTTADKKKLLEIARKTVEEYVKNKKIYTIDTAGFSDNLKKKCGAFVTLTKNSQLRGCIGQFSPDDPLYQVVQNMAISSSTNDYRFNPVSSSELSQISIEISVLTPLKKIKSVDEIELGKHGIYITKGGASGTFLPQVANETGWTKEDFLGHCAQDKAGIGWNGWKDADIYTYEAIVFSEKDTK
jgi:hypothetical protein